MLNNWSLPTFNQGFTQESSLSFVMKNKELSYEGKTLFLMGSSYKFWSLSNCVIQSPLRKDWNDVMEVQRVFHLYFKIISYETKIWISRSKKKLNYCISPNMSRFWCVVNLIVVPHLRTRCNLNRRLESQFPLWNVLRFYSL